MRRSGTSGLARRRARRITTITLTSIWTISLHASGEGRVRRLAAFGRFACCSWREDEVRRETAHMHPMLILVSLFAIVILVVFATKRYLVLQPGQERLSDRQVVLVRFVACAIVAAGLGAVALMTYVFYFEP